MSEELRLRIISAVFLAIVVLAGAWMGGFYFALLAQVIALLVYYEWCTITCVVSSNLRGYALGWVLMAVLALSCLTQDVSYSLAFLFAAVLLSAIIAVFQKASFWWPAGIAYAGLSGLSLAYIRGSDLAGLVAIIFLFAVVWGTDIAAYFVGRAIGGPKLAPRISPGKTWSGAVGGTIAGVFLSALVVMVFFRQPSLALLVVSFFLSVFSQIGDLFESHIKRRFGVKDSSKLIPGHGGVMDRVDGLVFASFGAFLFAIVQLLVGQGDITSLGGLFLDMG
ncbi:phosphatidate cytidylyltransferase [Rhizobium sp. L1K21]|uniref:phosphatidate cytidylyltransferase n=1 Tax=Rhizobium sp. L1K21 TaxID=2954933 RepID=UPI0020938867|nr:phosphatidate cytidylyltransferase [Rhizobium sp. L1K21]MCO6185993.1 phosphatidate cytidylyltransferase [Rhizobium sp. L1K21]